MGTHTHRERIVESSDSDDSVVYPALKKNVCGDVDNGVDFLHKDDGDDDMDVELLRNDDGFSDIFCGDDDGEDNEDIVTHTHRERIVESSDSDDSVVYPALKQKTKKTCKKHSCKFCQ